MRRDSVSEKPTRRTTRVPPPTTASGSTDPRASAKPAWTFLTNHAHALLCVAQSPGMRIREIAHTLGVTERCVQRVLAELEEAGYVTRVHQGRRNHYEVHADLPLRHPAEQHRQVSELLSLVLGARERDQDKEA